MKRKLMFTGVCLLLLFLLKFPSEALAASREGMGLWLNTLLPTLLPFLILTGILLHTGKFERILAPFSGFFRIAFGLSPAGAYVLTLGLLCGYPMGAKLAGDLYRYGRISRREAEYLLTFSNNPSPAFLITYLGTICLKGRTDIRKILGILILSTFLTMLMFRFLIYRNHTISKHFLSASKKEASKKEASKKETSDVTSPGAIIDVSIMNGFETITRLGGYILLFSLMAAVIHHFWISPSPGKYILLGITEITTGLDRICASSLPYQLKYLLSMTCTSLGGLCIMAQTKSVLEGKLSLKPYVLAKCLNGIFTAVLVWLLP